MPRIRLIVEDDSGKQTEQIFALPTDLNTLDDIDEAVEQFKNVTLPKVEQELLHQAQQRLATIEKKTVGEQTVVMP